MTTVVLGKDFILADQFYVAANTCCTAPKLFTHVVNNRTFHVAVVGQLPVQLAERATRDAIGWIFDASATAQAWEFNKVEAFYILVETEGAPKRIVIERMPVPMPNNPGQFYNVVEVIDEGIVGQGSGFKFAEGAYNLGVPLREIIPHVSVLDRFTSPTFDIVEVA